MEKLVFKINREIICFKKKKALEYLYNILQIILG